MKRAVRRRAGSTIRTASRRTWVAWPAAAALAAAAAVVAVVAFAGVGSAGSYAAPDFTMTVYQGEAQLGGEVATFHALLDGDRPVVLNFWASDCPPCREEMPSFQRVADELEGSFLLLGVDVGPMIGLGTRAGAVALLQELDVRYPTAFVDDADILRDFQVMSMPTTLFYDASGALVSRHAGYLPEANFRATVTELIAASE